MLRDHCPSRPEAIGAAENGEQITKSVRHEIINLCILPRNSSVSLSVQFLIQDAAAVSG
jgi:hypothetical protein